MKKSMEKAYAKAFKKQDGGKVSGDSTAVVKSFKKSKEYKEVPNSEFKKIYPESDTANTTVFRNKKGDLVRTKTYYTESQKKIEDGVKRLRKMEKDSSGNDGYKKELKKWQDEIMSSKKSKGGLVIAVGKMPKGKCSKGGKMKDW